MSFETRSIPAHAGEPRGRRRDLGVEKVYPRARGGAEIRLPNGSAIWGLSPRTRGSRGTG